MTALAGYLRAAAARLGSPASIRLPSDEFQHEKWASLHEGNSYFARDGGRPGEDALEMLRRRMDGRAIAEIDERHMAGSGTLQGKAVLEIGFGGGWYLAQALRGGARKAYGFEASDNIVSSTSDAFDRLGLGPYEFHRVDKRYLGAVPPASIDVAFSITVFQHIHPRATRGYLRSAAGALSDGGYCLFQFLMNEDHPVKNSNAPGSEGTVSYTKREADRMILAAGLRTRVYAETWRDGATGNYWAWYKLDRAPGGGGASAAPSPSPPPAPPPAKNSDNIPHIKGLIPTGALTVLDVGCGMLHDGNPPSEDMLLELYRDKDYAITGIDLHPPCIQWRKENGPPGEYAVMDARDVHTLGKRFDVVVCHHMIEHLPKDDGEALLARLEGIYGRLLVVATPSGFVDTEYNVRLHGNELERHLCGWNMAEFRDRGYYLRQIGNQFIAFKTSEAVPAGAAPSSKEAEERAPPCQGGAQG